MRGFRKNVSSGLDVFLGEQTGMCECEAAYSETGCNPSGPRDVFLSSDLRSTFKMLISTSWPSRRSLIEVDGGVRMVTPHSFTDNIVAIRGRQEPAIGTRSELRAPAWPELAATYLKLLKSEKISRLCVKPGHHSIIWSLNNERAQLKLNTKIY